VDRSAGVLPTGVAELTNGVLKMMMWERLKVTAAGIVVAVGISAALAARASQDPAKPGKLAADAPASAPVPGQTALDPRWTRAVPSGAIIEVLGVSPHPTGRDTWWRPDGTPLLQPPCDPCRAGIGANGNFVLRAVVVRITNLPPGAEHKWKVTEANGSSQGPAESGGKPVFGFSEVVFVVPSTLKFCTVRFEVAAGAWTTVQTWGTSEGAVGTTHGSYIFSAPIATKQGTTLSVTHDLHDVCLRVIAVDREGAERPSEFRSTAGVKDFVQVTVEFPLPLEQIKEFRVQTRPYEVVEVPGVALGRVGPG
jgi:hypothetical protein